MCVSIGDPWVQGFEFTFKMLEMVDGRNITAHIYNYEISEIPFRKLKDYSVLTRSTVGRLEL